MVEMKLALCTEILYPLYGVERRVYEMAKRLPNYGIDVDVYTSTSSRHFRNFNLFQVSKCTITSPPKRNYAFCINYMTSLFRQLMKHDYDMVHAEGHLSLIPCSLAAAMRKKPSVATIHDLYLAEWRHMYKSAASLAGAPFEVLSCKMPFDHVLTVNSSLKKKMEVILKIDSKKIQILHSGIDTKYIESVHSEVKDNSILYIGRLVPQKNVDVLIKAYASLPDELRKKHPLKIIGEGSELPKLQSLAGTLGIDAVFTGKIERHEDVIRELKSASVFVLPSRRESFGITILEAMFCGVPVVSTATEGPSDHVEDGKNGFLVNIGDYNQMSKKIEKVLTNSALKKNLVENAKKSAAQHDWENIAKNIANVYRKVLENRK